MFEIETEKYKSLVRKRIRDFFDKRGYIESDVPCLSKTAIPEHTIALFSTQREGEFTKKETLYLLPSPELYMKKMLCRYGKSIYQITKSFRNAEQTSPYHNSEFTMLEYYTIDCDYRFSIELTAALIKEVFFDAVNKNLLLKPEVISISSILKKYTGFNLEELHEEKNAGIISEKFSLNLPSDESFDDRFNRIFVHIIEPALKEYKAPVILTDYPAEIECLAKQDGIIRERFEMYINGIEIANGYTELTDLKKIKELFKNEDKLIKEAGRKQQTDTDLQNELLPDSSGVAIGLDRLIMVSNPEKFKSITDVMCFV